jgi:predicted phage terminase large subunit-like protein
MTGTILDNDSLLKKVSKNLIKDHLSWKVLFYQALNVSSDGIESALWQEMKPLSELKAIQNFDPESFAKEYQNDPRAGMMGVFKQEWYQHYDEVLLRNMDGEWFYNNEPLSIMACTDLAVSSKQGSDWTVIMVTGMDRHMNLYVLEINRFRTSDPDVVIDEIFKTCATWGCDMLTMEVVAFQKTFVRFFEKEMDRRNIQLNIIELTRPSTTKLQRIKSVAAPIKNGLIKWTMDMPELEDELNAVTAMKTGAHDDIIDALADAWEQQVEHNESERKIEVPVNTFEWMVKEGYLPTIAEDSEYIQ